MRFPFTHYIERGDDEIELSVIYDGTRPVAATYWQPAEGAEVELISIRHNGAHFDLTDAEESALLEVCAERVGSDFHEEDCAAAEWRAQNRADDLLMARWEREGL